MGNEGTTITASGNKSLLVCVVSLSGSIERAMEASMATQVRKAHNSIDKTMTGSLAALTIGFAVLGAVVPSYADQNNYVSPSFPTDGVVRLGLSPAGSADGAYTAYYRPGNGQANSCAPVVVHHQMGDTIVYPAPGSC
jgi:hypothetical protein